jgi:hypothetical protein
VLDVDVEQPGSQLCELRELADDLARDEMEAARARMERDVALHPHRSGIVTGAPAAARQRASP